MEDENSLNMRMDDRYFINEIPLAGIGSIVEVSRNGLRIKKVPGHTIDGPVMALQVGSRQIKGAIRWSDTLSIGLRTDGLFNDPSQIRELLKKAKENVAPPQMKVTDKAIQQYKKDEVVVAMVNLLMEVESLEPNVIKIGQHINEVCTLEEKQAKPDEQEPEEKAGFPSFRDILIEKASDLQGTGETIVKDLNFAVTRLGINNIRVILRNAVHNRITRSNLSAPVFPDYETCNILKSIVYKNLCAYFGFTDIQSEGNALLSFETAGVEILIRESMGILDSYYKNPSRLYAEVSRVYERSFFGVDPLQIDKYYFAKCLEAFSELSDGYILAHCIHNPHYAPADELKLSLTKDGMIFSYMAHLALLAIEFIMDKNRESGYVLQKKLRGKGMDGRKLLGFIEKSINETNTILKDFDIKKSIVAPSLPEGSIALEGYLGKDARFDYLVRSFQKFDRGNARRLALRYDDESYAHFILSKILSADSLSLNARTVCIVPCGNVSLSPWYIKDFSFFDLLIFKDLQALPDYHQATLLTLWKSFEGQIITTFSTAELMDFAHPRMHSALVPFIVDFPSYFHNDHVYNKMVEHTANYLKPYYGEQKVDTSRYLKEVYTMNHIKSDILLTKEIS